MDMKSLTKVAGKELVDWRADCLRFVPVLLMVMIDGVAVLPPVSATSDSVVTYHR